MDWSSELWIVLLFVGISLVIGVRVYASQSRKKALTAVAARLGLLRLEGKAPFSSEERKGFSLFSRGNGRKWENIFSSNAPVTELLFDFGYTFGIPLLASVRYRQTVAAFSARLTNLPDFQMTPATTLDRMAPKVGFQAIQFASRPDFGKRYWIRANDEIAVRALFSDTFIDRMSAADPKTAWYVEKGGQWLLVYRHGVLFAPEALPEFRKVTHEIASLFLKTS